MSGIKFTTCELRVMSLVNALISEILANLEHFLESAY